MIANLIAKGKDQGYLLSDDIIDMFPNAEEQMDTLEEFYSTLVAQGIEVLDQKPVVRREACTRTTPVPDRNRSPSRIRSHPVSVTRCACTFRKSAKRTC